MLLTSRMVRAFVYERGAAAEVAAHRLKLSLGCLGAAWVAWQDHIVLVGARRAPCKTIILVHPSASARHSLVTLAAGSCSCHAFSAEMIGAGREHEVDVRCEVGLELDGVDVERAVDMEQRRLSQGSWNITAHSLLLVPSVFSDLPQRCGRRIKRFGIELGGKRQPCHRCGWQH